VFPSAPCSEHPQYSYTKFIENIILISLLSYRPSENLSVTSVLTHYTTLFLQYLRPTQPLIHWIPGDLTPGLKRPDREADRSPPSSAEVKNT